MSRLKVQESTLEGVCQFEQKPDCQSGARVKFLYLKEAESAIATKYLLTISSILKKKTGEYLELELINFHKSRVTPEAEIKTLKQGSE